MKNRKDPAKKLKFDLSSNINHKSFWLDLDFNDNWFVLGTVLLIHECHIVEVSVLHLCMSISLVNMSEYVHFRLHSLDSFSQGHTATVLPIVNTDIIDSERWAVGD